MKAVVSNVLLILILYSCSMNKSEVVVEKVDKLKQTKIESKAFMPDTSVNGIWYFANDSSSLNFYTNIDKEKLISFKRSSPIIAFTNKSESLYLLGYFHEGGVKNNFYEFEIGEKKNLEKIEVIKTNYLNFEPESGIRIGMSREDIINLKGVPDSSNNQMIIYEIENYDESKFLKRYRLPYYYFKVHFTALKADLISYGFEYP